MLKKIMAAVLAALLALTMVPAMAEETKLLETPRFDFQIPTSFSLVDTADDVYYLYQNEDGSRDLIILTNTLSNLPELLETDGEELVLRGVTYALLTMLTDSDSALTIANAGDIVPLDDSNNYFKAETPDVVIVSRFIGIDAFLIYITGGDVNDEADSILSTAVPHEGEAPAAPALEAEPIYPEPEAVGTIVVTGNSANIRTGPGAEYDKLFTAYQGDTFPLLGQDGTWYIIDANGQTGYISSGLSSIK